MKNLPDENQKKATSKRAAYKRELARSVWKKNEKNMSELIYEGRAAGFTVIPDEVIYSGEYLTHGEKTMWLAIFSHNYQQDQMTRVSWPGVERLAILNGIGERQALIYLKGLKDKDLLLTRRRQDKSSLMILLDPPKKWMEETQKKLDKREKKEDIS